MISLVVQFTTFTRQSAGTESLKIVALDIVCQKIPILSSEHCTSQSNIMRCGAWFVTAPVVVHCHHMVDLFLVRSRVHRCIHVVLLGWSNSVSANMAVKSSHIQNVSHKVKNNIETLAYCSFLSVGQFHSRGRCVSLCCAVSVLCACPRVKTGHSTQHRSP